MEEKRRETGSSSPAPTISGASSHKSTDSPATEPPPPRRRGQKRKSTTTTSHSSAPPKRHAREKAAAAAAAASGGLFSLLPPIHNGPLTRARQLSDNNAAIFSALNASKNDHSSSVNDSVANNEGREEKVSAAQEEFKKFMAEVDAEFDAIRCRDSNVHVVPIAAGWFSWTTVHSIEKQTLRSFFNGKVENRTPEIYQEIRNWIMKKFHANPSSDIELKDLSDLSIGDLEARQEVMEFLDHWGLINYHPFLQNDPANVDADPNTDADKAEKTDSVIEKLFQFENEQSSSDLAPRANWSAAAVPSGIFPESIAEELVKQEGPAVEYHCNSCSADCSRKRYHCQKQADFDLCSECYNNGKFGSGMCPSDFILMEPAESSGGTGGKWTDQETLLLLEALELYKENWNEIAEHVATKTKAQCILHFLQMPIEDNFLDDDDVTKDGALENKEPTTSINNESSVPKDNSEPSEGITTKDNSGPAENGSGKEPAESGSGKGNSEGAITKDGSGPAESGSGKGDSEGPIAKDHAGPAESGIGIGNSEGAISKDNSGPAESGNDKGNLDILTSNSSKEDSEPLDRKTKINDAEPVLTQLETSKSEDAPDGKVAQGKEEDVVIKALKEAFHVAGCPLTPEDQLSFAEAGNSVMALAAFLTQLVEPGLATAYAHNSLKTISKSIPGAQLAIRHCFILEDPADDENKHVCESMASEKNDQNAPELSKEEMTNEKLITSSEENSPPILDGSHSTKGQGQKVESSSIRDDSQLPLGEQDAGAVNSGFPEKPGEEIPQTAEKPDEKSELAEKPDEEMPQASEKVDEKSSVSEKPDDEKSQVAVKLDDEKLAEKHDETNDTEQAGTKLVTETQTCSMQNEQPDTSKDQVASESEVMPSPCSAIGSDNLKKNEADNDKSSNSTKDTVVEPSSVVSDKTQQQEKTGEVPTVEAAPETGEDNMDVDKTGDSKSTEKTAEDPKSKEKSKIKEDDNVAKLKRAALATLSAAAVKSKLLANQEEDEIRQLATILIEKQMRKLEVKLSYFTEMESAITRVRDQLERSRQKLFNERAQIIASRLGIPPSSSRMLPSSFPVNRMPPGLLNSMLRPPMGMGAQRPPMSRPIVTSAPPTTGTSAPPEVTGGSPRQPSAVDQPSSVGAD